MSAYLGEHPEVFMPDAKELLFFGSDLAPKREMDEEEYLSHFRRAGGEKRIGEASVMYLSSETAAREIKRFSPNASIIIMLRNPVDAIYARYTQMRRNGLEDIEDFALALDAERDRRKGRRLPAVFGWRNVHRSPKYLCYRDTAAFAAQVKRYYGVFTREKVHVIVFDDLVRDPAAVFRGVLGFLRVDDRFEPRFRTVNANARARSRTLQLFLLNSPRSISRAAQRVLPRRVRQAVSAAMLRLNTKTEQRPPMNPSLRGRLQADFRPEVQRLSALLRRDLTHWCEPPSES